jgi:hypothetical protein
MRIPVLAGMLVVGGALLLAAPATSEAGRRVSYGVDHHIRSRGSYSYRSYGYRPYAYRSYCYRYRPYVSLGFLAYDYDPYYYDPYYAYDYADPYYYRPAPVYVPRVYYAPRPVLGYFHRGRPHVNVRIGF